MRLSEFIALPEEHKRSTVLTKGVAIAKRKEIDRQVFLFQLNEYYVETLCCSKSKEILEYRVFDDTAQLKPYLDAIEIRDLFR